MKTCVTIIGIKLSNKKFATLPIQENVTKSGVFYNSLI